MEYSNCCNAPFIYPGWPDSDICSKCYEHAEPEIETIDRDTAKKYIYKTNGKIFSAVFRKKDGEKRLMNCRTKVQKYLKGVGLKFKPQERGLVTVFDLQKGAYRFINLETLERLKIQGVEYEIITNKKEIKR